MGDQFNGATFAQAGSQSRWSHFDEGRGSQTLLSLNPTGHKPALQIVIAELQSRRSATEPVNTGKVGRGFPELVGNASAGSAGGIARLSGAGPADGVAGVRCGVLSMSLP